MEDIKLLKIEYGYTTFLPEGIKELNWIKVMFDYKKVEECKIVFNTDKELSIAEIKEKILSEIRR